MATRALGWLTGLQPFALAAAPDANYGNLLALSPVGYWPADEGKGTVLHDRSGNANHGTIYSVPWTDGLLVFENDVYQWIQVPCRESLDTLPAWTRCRRCEPQ